ncbi:Crossover junction endonuclease EME1 [Melipona quadrifasciata]|uniref:Crossover junction endonuclease EME1 n=1 Tax=Melipona quadrifasciata TaxID=166423 RepID=A0A0M9AA21_9HYME|nr:Crossover junction endonuclease EME1 [Melipona quadrifasciata]
MLTDIVVLSDSNESLNECVQLNSNNKALPGDSSDFEFPEINFYHIINGNDVGKSQDADVASCSSNFNSNAPSQQTNNDKHDISNKHFKQHKTRKLLYDTSDSFSSDEENRNKKRQKKGKNIIGKKSRIQINEEKLKKQEQLMKEKALKAIAARKLKNIKPNECMKFIEVTVDKAIANFTSITDVTDTLRDAEVKCTVKTKFISNSITWKRNIENSYVNDDNEICTVTDAEKVSQILVIWNWDEVATKITNGDFCTSVSSIKCSLPNYKITLVVYEKYLQLSKHSCDISRKQLETHLNEIQIIADCSSRVINNSQDLALMIYQYTKAIAEVPYKLEKNKNLINKFDWYVMGDNRNTVKIDKNGNGLKRLWQQQLCQFNLSSLEIAEAICSMYPSPAHLIEYMNCTDDEGINLLKDIPIRRAAGPLTTVRKIGPELSKKIYLMFTSKNGEIVLS